MTVALDMLTGWLSRSDDRFNRIGGDIASEFAPAEPHQQTSKYMEGLLSCIKRKNG